jgi:hypothetical protein
LNKAYTNAEMKKKNIAKAMEIRGRQAIFFIQFEDL